MRWGLSRLSLSIEFEPFYKGCIDRPATGRQDVLDRLQRAEHHAVVHPNYALAPVLLNDLRIQQLGQGHPARFGTGSLVLAALGVRPHAKVAQDGREITLKPVAEPRGHTP